jgi:hypothetical protein
MSDVLSLYPQTLVIGSGVTAQITRMPGQHSAVLKWGSGGTLWIIGVTTMAQGSSFMSNRQYLVGVSESVNINCRANLYLMATGATVTCYVLRGLSSGYEV